MAHPCPTITEEGRRLLTELRLWHKRAESEAGAIDDGLRHLDATIDRIDDEADREFNHCYDGLSLAQQAHLYDLEYRRRVLDDRRADLVKAMKALDQVRDELTVLA